MTSETSIALLFVSFGSGEEIVRALESVTGSTAQPQRIVVADNLCDGVLRDQLSKYSSRVTIYDYPDNPGYGGAINRLAAELEPHAVEWLLIANPDIEFESTAIAALLEAGKSVGIGAIGPKVLDGNGHVYPSARRIPSIRTGIGHALFSRVWPSNPWTQKYFDNSDSGTTRDAGWLSGACLMVRTSAFRDIGGFDEEYFMYFEDVDLGFRLGHHGWRNVYTPDAVVHHSGGHSTKDHSAQMRAAHHRSAEVFLRRRYPGLWRAPIRCVLGIGLRIRERFGT